MDAKVPQNIDMQDKVIGPLTLQQFFYLLFGGLFVYLLNGWMTGYLRPFFWLIAIPTTVLSFCLAFIKIQERPFLIFLFSLLKFASRPRSRVWQKGQYQKMTKIVTKVDETPKVAPHKEYDRSRVEDIVRVIDQGSTTRKN